MPGARQRPGAGRPRLREHRARSTEPTSESACSQQPDTSAFGEDVPLNIRTALEHMRQLRRQWSDYEEPAARLQVLQHAAYMGRANRRR
jgi:hypothetical protein